MIPHSFYKLHVLACIAAFVITSILIVLKTGFYCRQSYFVIVIVVFVIILYMLSEYRRLKGYPSFYDRCEYFLRRMDVVDMEHRVSGRVHPLKIPTRLTGVETSIFHCTVLGLVAPYNEYPYYYYTVDGTTRPLLATDKYCFSCGLVIQKFERRLLFRFDSMCYQCFHKEIYQNDLKRAMIIRLLNWFDNKDIDHIIIQLSMHSYEAVKFI